MKPRIWLVLSLFAVAVASLYAVRVLLPSARYRDGIHNGIKAQMGDLYSPWVGARELLLHHRNPYGEEVTHQIQMVFYGHAISQNYAEPATAVMNEQRFAYPVYTVFILAPTVYADFAHVRRWVCFALGLLTAISVLLCLSLLHQRLPWETVAALLLFTLSTPQIIQGLRFQQLALLVSFLLVAGTWCASKHYLVTAGALLAISTTKPQMALLPLCGFAIWAVGDWPKRWRLAAS
ncbi:MAG: glycosyltransferase family 87 protein, partial [Candidatus Sulfotelmatobacter sp.]